jgi:hypothetical protein
MLPAFVESIRPLLDLASRASEPLALLGLGAVLIALSFQLRSRPARPVRPVRPVDPAPAPTAQSRSRIAPSSPLAAQQGR